MLPGFHVIGEGDNRESLKPRLFEIPLIQEGKKAIYLEMFSVSLSICVYDRMSGGPIWSILSLVSHILYSLHTYLCNANKCVLKYKLNLNLPPTHTTNRGVYRIIHILL